MREPSDPAQPERRSIGLLLLRYGIGGVMVAAGIVMLIVDPSGLGADGFAMAVGGGLSVLLINFLYRLGVSGDREREDEERARLYFDEHGEWPEEQVKVRERKWRLAPGIQTPEDEERRRRSGA
jgi:hypothetical protein